MESKSFAYWLQGFFEIKDAENNGVYGLTSAQTHIIKQHLALVFKHEIDPAMGNEEHQQELNNIHNSVFPSFTKQVSDWAQSNPIGNEVFRC